MPRRTSPDWVPSYRLHKPSGLAVVRLNGRDVYLGRHGSAESKAEYQRLIALWLASNRQATPQPARQAVVLSVVPDPAFTVTELCAAYWLATEELCRELGRSPCSLYALKAALGWLRRLYGPRPAADFGPGEFELLRNAMIDDRRADGSRRLSRRTVNAYAKAVKAVFRWGERKRLVAPGVWASLRTVDGLRYGESPARETAPVTPVADEIVEATIAKLTPMVADMVRVHRLTGMRSGELLAMTTGAMDTSGRVWIYRPARHKTAHHGLARTVAIGPRAQKILKGYLRPDLAAPLFSPREAEAQRLAALHERRRTPLSCGNKPGTNRRARPARAPGEWWTVASYRRAIERACDAAFPPPARLRPRLLENGRRESARAFLARLTVKEREELAAWRRDHRWHPHQLRHTAATEARRHAGIEAAQAVLGHAQLKVTEVYAERNMALAATVAVAIG